MFNRRGMVKLKSNDALKNNYLKFKSTDGANFQMNFQGRQWDGTLYYSFNAITWIEWDGSEITSTNKVIYLRGKNNTKMTGHNWTTYPLSVYGNTGVRCTGNIDCLLDWEKVRDEETIIYADYCYHWLFGGCAVLKEAPSFTNLTLTGQYCYSMMFYWCTSLTAAPRLPATTLSQGCYSYMFHGSGITAAPSLPATILAENCYENMFQGCSSMVVAPKILPAEHVFTKSYSGMFAACRVLVEGPEILATEVDANGCERMFWDCTALASLPSITNTVLIGLYGTKEMFCGCTSLVLSPFTSIEPNGNYCCWKMFYGCISLITAPSLPSTFLFEYCYYEMFRGCTSLIYIVKLPATDIVAGCYEMMFYGCSNIKISTTSGGIYTRAYRIPHSGTGTEGRWGGRSSMFSNTGGTFTGTPSINTTYYTSNTVV